MANIGDIGTAHITVELDFQRALQEAKRVGDQVPPIDLRVDLDQGQVTREVATKITAAEREAGQVDARIDVDRTQAITAVRTALTAASAAAGTIPVRVDQSSLNTAATRIRTTIGGAFAAAGRLGSAALLPAALGFGAFALQLKKGSDDAKVLSTSLSGVDQVLSRFGKTSGVTRKQITDMAARFETFSSISEESIQGAAASLVQFGVANKRNLPAVTKLLLNTAAGMKQVSDDGEVSNAFAVKFGRALQDPAKGLALLAKGGVAVSASQKKLVKDLAKAGKTAEATAVVTGLLEKNFTGAAQNLAKTVPGQLRIATDSFADARRDITSKILPGIVPIIGKLSKQIGDALNNNQGAIVQFVTGFVRGAAAFIDFVRTSETLHAVFRAIGSVISGVAAGFKGFSENFSKAFNESSKGQAVSLADALERGGRIIGEIARVLLPLVGTALGGFAATVGVAMKAATAAFHGLAAAVRFVGGVIASWRIGVGVALAAVKGAFDTWKIGVQAAFTAVKNAVSVAVAFIGSSFSRLIGILGAVAHGFISVLGGINLFTIGLAVVKTLEDGLRAGFEKVKDFVKSIAHTIKSLKGPIEFDRRLLVDEGRAIMSGFDKGLHQRWAGIRKWISNIGGFFKGAISGDSLKETITNALLGKGDIDGALNANVAAQLGIPAGLFGGEGIGAAGFLHPTSGWADTLSQVRLIEKMFGVGMTSGLRNYDTVAGPGVSQHTLGQAADFGDSRASHATLTTLATFASRLRNVFKQVIWLNSLWENGTGGHGFIPNHMDHVHLGWQARAAGGSVRKGQPYQWNERGSEMLIPHGNGYVMNAGRTKELISAIKSIAQRPSQNTRHAEIHVHSNAADPAAVGGILMSNLGGVFSRA